MPSTLPDLTLRRLLFVVGALLVSVNLLSAIWDLRNSRTVVVQDAQRGFGNLATLLADQIARSLESIDIMLAQSASEISREGLGDGREMQRRLRDRISAFPRIRDMIVLDRRGQLVLRTDPSPAPVRDFSDREYFTAHRDGRHKGAVVSEPFVSRISGKWSFAVSRRLTDENGAFAGIVAAIVEVEYVDNVFRSLDMGTAGFTLLATSDGMPVTAVPPMPASRRGHRFADPEGVTSAVRDHGRFDGWITGQDISTERLLASARAVPEEPLVVVVGSTESAVYAPWRDESERVMVRTLLTSAVMLALMWVAARELARRENAERAAQEERERMQRRLRQGEKMEAIGRLSGGIAHDFNNILGGMMGYTEMLLEDLPPGSPLHGYASKLLAAAQRARQLVEQILTYSRTAKVARQPIELGKIVRETLDVMRGSIPRGIRIEGVIPAVPAVTLGDATQLHEVVMNLCTNAVHAMGESGTLTVRLDTVDLDVPVTLSHGSLEPGKYLKLTAADTGAGMDDATLAHIFEPFFTTREVGGGTGLGLAIVYGIVADSNGAISVASAPGRGSTFEIYLPAADVALPPPNGRQKKEAERGHGQRILLVDDEVPLLDMMVVMLGRLGYKPERHSDPRAALAAFEARPHAYDLVLTDEAMPGLPGTALARALKKVRMDIPVVIVTGRAEESFSRAAAEAGVAEVLLKPVESRDLAAALARQLAPQGISFDT